MISADFLQQLKLVNFSGGITYNSNGYAVLPSYNIVNILASVQPLSKSEIRFLPEGTHYADFINILTDYNVDVDNSPTNLGDYFIYKNNVYKIYSSQDYKQFTSFSTNHIETTVARDNRIIFDGTSLNIPFPELDDSFAPLFELITLASQCFSSPPLTVLWGYQQELRPLFPYCVVNIEGVENLDNTNYTTINSSNELVQSKSSVLTVSYKFYTYDKVQAQNYLETFKINFENFTFTSDKIAYLGFEDSFNILNEELYENRTIFNGEVRMKFSLVVEQTQISTMTINTAAATLSFTT